MQDMRMARGDNPGKLVRIIDTAARRAPMPREQRIRSSLHLAGASFAGIEQAREAVAAAEKSLEVVQEAYSLGSATILDLLDAQNAAFSAEQVAANAVYDFLIDLVEVERRHGDPERWLPRLAELLAVYDGQQPVPDVVAARDLLGR